MASLPKQYSATIGTGKKALARAVMLEPVEEETGSDGEPHRWKLSVDGVSQRVDAQRLPTGAWSLLIAGESWVVDVDTGKDGALLVSAGDGSVPVRLVDSMRERLGQHVLRKTDSGPTVMRSQMPGKVIKIVTKEGDKVSTGQGLLLVEAMKMENELVATKDGVVKEIHVKEGQIVEAQEALITLNLITPK